MISVSAAVTNIRDRLEITPPLRSTYALDTLVVLSCSMYSYYRYVRMCHAIPSRAFANSLLKCAFAR